jgi:hypothetical protein
MANPMHGIVLPPDHQQPPCSTLFVANLGHNTTEEELKKLFGPFPAFKRLKMLRNKGTTPVSFVEYTDVMSASQAKALLHGQVLASCENGGIRIEFARNRMGEMKQQQPGASVPTTEIPPQQQINGIVPQPAHMIQA